MEGGIEADTVITTAALRDLIRMLPDVPAEVQAAANGLRYRDFLTVGLIVNAEELWPDTWIYVHDDSVMVGRIQNFKNWSPTMVPDPTTTSLGLEYFVSEGDRLWRMADADLIALGTREIEALKLLPEGAHVTDGFVIRVPKTYPIYDDGYETRVATIRGFLETRHPRIITGGRNGMHRYNNQDHSMLTAMLAVENLLDGARNDLWSINTDRVYHEEKRKE
mgnify:FL=1